MKPIAEAKCVDPWAIVRAAHPNADLVRVIDRSRGVQFFLQIPRPRKKIEGPKSHLEMFGSDGTTYFIPAIGRAEPRDPTAELGEQMRIVAEADAAWTAQ